MVNELLTLSELQVRAMDLINNKKRLQRNIYKALIAEIMEYTIKLYMHSQAEREVLNELVDQVPIEQMISNT